SATIPPIHASFEIAVTDVIGVGGLLGYTASKYEYGGFPYSYSYKHSYLIFGARGAYHFHEFVDVENLDLYAGLMLGFNVSNSTYDGPNNSTFGIDYDDNSGGIIFGGFAGARYAF